jgi:hypothetical protein
MKHAKTAANWFAKVGEAPAHGCVYDDGAIIYVCVTEDTQAQIVTEMGDGVKECARSDNGLCGAIIVKPDYWRLGFCVVAEIMELGWRDCRQMDAHTIELSVGQQLRRLTERH